MNCNAKNGNERWRLIFFPFLDLEVLAMLAFLMLYFRRANVKTSTELLWLHKLGSRGSTTICMCGRARDCCYRGVHRCGKGVRSYCVQHNSSGFGGHCNVACTTLTPRSTLLLLAINLPIYSPTCKPQHTLIFLSFVIIDLCCTYVQLNRQPTFYAAQLCRFFFSFQIYTW